MIESFVTVLILGAIALLIAAYRRTAGAGHASTKLDAPEFGALIQSSRRIPVAEDSRKESNAAAPGWIRMLPIPFMIVDFDGVIKFCSDELATLLAVERKGIERSNYSSLISNETPVAGSVVSTIDWVLAATSNVQDLKEKSFPIYMRGSFAGTSTAARVGNDPNTGKDLFMVALRFSEERKLTAALLYPSPFGEKTRQLDPAALNFAFPAETVPLLPHISELILTVRSLYRSEIKLRTADSLTTEPTSLKITVSKPILAEFLRSLGAMLVSVASSTKKVEITLGEQEIETESSGEILGLKMGRQLRIEISASSPTEALVTLSNLIHDDHPAIKTAAQLSARSFFNSVKQMGGAISIDTSKRGQQLYAYLPERVEIKAD